MIPDRPDYHIGNKQWYSTSCARLARPLSEPCMLTRIVQKSDKHPSSSLAVGGNETHHGSLASAIILLEGANELQFLWLSSAWQYLVLRQVRGSRIQAGVWLCW